MVLTLEEKEIVEKLKKDPYYIKSLTDVTEDMALVVVRENGALIRYIKNPSENVMWEALKQNPWTIEYIYNPNEDMCLYVVEKAWNSLKYIKNPSYNVIKKAIESKGWAIQFAQNPDIELQKVAVEKDFDSIKFIKNPSCQIQMIAVKKDWSSIKFIDNPCEEAELESIRNNEEAMRYIHITDEKINKYIKINVKVAKYLQEEKLKELESIIIEEIAKEEVDDQFMLDFIECNAFKFDKVRFIYKYGSMKAKTVLLDYKLGM